MSAQPNCLLMAPARAPGFFVAFKFANRPALPAIRNNLDRQKVGFYFLTNVE
jgi:hypothetical protein